VKRIEQALAVFTELERIYPNRQPLILFSNCFELTVAVILSAQCTDAQVNAVTPRLFKRYPDPAALGAADIAELEKIIHSVGFFHQKARFIKNTARLLTDVYQGIVPVGMKELLSFPGIGRKSAHVIRAHCFGKPAIIVDTHFGRVVRRLGLTETRNPDIIERHIAGLLPPETWTSFSMTVNLHGRAVCQARKPRCGACGVKSLCDYFVLISPEG